jgi:hypothetical protein
VLTEKRIVHRGNERSFKKASGTLSACLSLIRATSFPGSKRPVMQSHGITLAFHREMADSSRELVGPDITAAVTLERYPRFIKGGFQDYEGLGIKRSTADSKHVPSLRSRLLGNNVFWSLPQKESNFWN